MNSPRLTLLAAMSLALACGSQPEKVVKVATPQPVASVEPSGPGPYDDSRLLKVAVEMSPADWDKIRFQHQRSEEVFGDDCLARPRPRPYDYVAAHVTVAGQRFEASKVRKKGFLGSVNSRRPSLKVKLNGTWRGISRLTLNNNQQDPSQVHQCLAYRVFRAAGVPAPRCTLAHVTVNGEDKGVFSHIEPIRKRFLKAHFGEDGGNLYEGAMSDFRPTWRHTFEPKGTRKGDQSDLQVLTAHIEKGDIAALARAVDLDAFYRFWAAEVLIGHWDGYTNDLNNFYTYRHPGTGALHFIPWGADSVFGDPDVFKRGDPPISVYAHGALSRLLYSEPQTRDRYRVQLRALLAEAWDEDALLAEVDRLVALAKPHLDISEKRHQIGVDKVKKFIRGRRAALEAELAGEPPIWKLPLRSSPCPETLGTMSGEFKAPWRSLESPDYSTGSTLQVELDGKKLKFAAVGVAAATVEDGGGRTIISLVGMRPDGPMVIALLMVDPERYRPGTLPIDSYSVFGIAMTLQLGSAPKGIGGLNGELTLRTIGDTVTGSFSAKVTQAKYMSDPLE